MHVTLLLADQCSAASATMALEILSAANLFAELPARLLKWSSPRLRG